MYVNHVITPTAEGATGTNPPHRDRSRRRFRNKVEHQGHYEDVYVKTPKGWLFKSRIHVLAPGQAEVSSGRKPGTQR